MVDELTANLKLFPLLLKRFEIADLTLTHPHIQFTRDRHRQLELDAPAAAAGDRHETRRQQRRAVL